MIYIDRQKLEHILVLDNIIIVLFFIYILRGLFHCLQNQIYYNSMKKYENVLDHGEILPRLESILFLELY